MLGTVGCAEIVFDETAKALCVCVCRPHADTPFPFTDEMMLKQTFPNLRFTPFLVFSSAFFKILCQKSHKSAINLLSAKARASK